ncbi:MAG: hypothetical protein WKG52_04800 [Variovorax sp.]
MLDFAQDRLEPVHFRRLRVVHRAGPLADDLGIQHALDQSCAYPARIVVFAAHELADGRVVRIDEESDEPPSSEIGALLGDFEEAPGWVELRVEVQIARHDHICRCPHHGARGDEAAGNHEAPRLETSDARLSRTATSCKDIGSLAAFMGHPSGKANTAAATAKTYRETGVPTDWRKRQFDELRPASTDGHLSVADAGCLDVHLARAQPRCEQRAFAVDLIEHLGDFRLALFEGEGHGADYLSNALAGHPALVRTYAARRRVPTSPALRAP